MATLQATTVTGDITADQLVTPDSGWNDITLLNGWTHYSSIYWGPCRYRKHQGIVWFQGLVQMPTTNPNGTTVATLPAGYRPEYRQLVPCATIQGHYRIDITPAGNVLFYGYAGTAGGWADFTKLRFVAA